MTKISGTIGYLLGIVGGFGGLAYNVITPEQSDMIPTIIGLLGGKMIGDGLEYLIMRD